MNPYLAVLLPSLAVSTAVVLAVIACEVRDAVHRRRARSVRTAAIVRVSTAAVVSPKDAGCMDDLWLELLATPRIPSQREGE